MYFWSGEKCLVAKNDVKSKRQAGGKQESEEKLQTDFYKLSAIIDRDCFGPAARANFFFWHSSFISWKS